MSPKHKSVRKRPQPATVPTEKNIYRESPQSHDTTNETTDDTTGGGMFFPVNPTQKGTDNGYFLPISDPKPWPVYRLYPDGSNDVIAVVWTIRHGMQAMGGYWAEFERTQPPPDS